MSANSHTLAVRLPFYRSSFQMKGEGKWKNNWIINSFTYEAFGMLRIIAGKEKAAERELMGSYFGEKAYITRAMVSGSSGISGKLLHQGVEGQGDGRCTESTCNTFISQVL